MLRLACAMLLFVGASQARADVILACAFPTLPDVVMSFPTAADAQKTMSVAARPPVPLTEGQGTGRLITATVDGYDFRFAPANSVLDVERDGKPVLSETGECITIGGPENGTPLAISPPEAGASTDSEQDAEPSVAPTSTGRWQVRTDSSAFDDSTTVILTIDSTDPIRGQFGGPGPASMVIRCKENTTSLYLWLNDLFLSDIQGYGVVDYRVDDDKAASLRMASSTDNKALGLWDGGTSIPFIKTLLEGDSVVFRATPYNESAVEFSFDLAGLSNAIPPLREACGW